MVFRRFICLEIEFAHGTVVDDTGLTVIGASVVVENDRTIGTITDIDGKYVLENVPSEGKLIFSYMGMQTQTISVAGRTTINVTMKTDDKVLEEVVVVGYRIPCSVCSKCGASSAERATRSSEAAS